METSPRAQDFRRRKAGAAHFEERLLLGVQEEKLTEEEEGELEEVMK
jgi:hypothetical protein